MDNEAFYMTVCAVPFKATERDMTVMCIEHYFLQGGRYWFESFM
jgi:hypothetical protein